MFYCKNCNFSLEITKNSALNPDNDITQIRNLATPQELVKVVLNNADVGNDVQFKISFNLNTLKDYLSEQKQIYEDQYQAVIDKFQQIVKQQKNTVQYYFICNTCSTSYVLQPGTVIYSINYDKSSGGLVDDDVTVRAQDPILPRTKDYTCPNKSCTSHKNLVDKEAVFYRNNKNFHLAYICTLCNTKWSV